MRKTILTLSAMILLVVGTAGAAKKKAYVDFDRNADFGAIKTFAYVDTFETSVADSAPPIHEMIKYLIIIRFKESGLVSVGVDDNPDICVTYHTNVNQEMKMDVTLYSYTYSWGWYWSPLWGSGMDVKSYSRGTLVIDAWYPTKNELIWRGTVVGAIPDDPSPAKAQKVIEDALDKIGDEWKKQRSAAQAQ
jgi:hypothetical protein